MHFRIVCTLMVITSSISCFQMRKSHGGGQDNKITTRRIDTSDIALSFGYEISLVADSLNFPTAIAFDEKDQAYVIESGYAYGEIFTEPRLIRLVDKKIIASGKRNGPWTGISFHQGDFYIAEGGQAEGGKILRVNASGEMTSLVEKLPGMGDHHTNGPVIRDGYIYFGQGTATNSAVVGPDNAKFGWLGRHPRFHDIPCLDLTLNGVNYSSDSAGQNIQTGAYLPYGQTSAPGQVIKGAIPCSGAILRMPLLGGELEWIAWGFRNPFGLAFSPDGTLYATENGFDSRGSRPVWGAGDVLWKVENGFWYGWPDYAAGKAVWDDEEFKTPGKERVRKLLSKDPGTVPKPAAILGVHSSSNGIDFSGSDLFGFKSQAFIAQFGDMAPDVGKVLGPVGFKIIRVDPLTGVVRDFATNKGRKNGPASMHKRAGLERPVSVKFSNDGKALYVVDFGIMNITKKEAQPVPYTGVVWKINLKKS